MHTDLSELTGEISNLGLKVKIDTNGAFPKRLAVVEPEFVALDLKTSPGKYGLLLGDTIDTQFDLFDENPSKDSVWGLVEATLKWIAESEVQYELRTTAVPGIVSVDDVDSITDIAGSILGTSSTAFTRGRYVLAGFRPGTTLDPLYADKKPFPESTIRQMQELVEGKGFSCSIRWNT